MKGMMLAILTVFFVSACSSAPRSSNSDSSPRFIGGNGKSISEAIIIRGAKNEMEGIAAEKYWLRENMPGWSLVRQELFTEKDKVYDGLKIRSTYGEERLIYFDITSFFGKF